MFRRVPIFAACAAVVIGLATAACVSPRSDAVAQDGPRITVDQEADPAVRPPEPTSPPAAPAARWDYKAMTRGELVQLPPGDQGEYILPDDVLENFNRGLRIMGDDGWELVGIEPYHREGYVSWPAIYTFRRGK